MKLFGRWETKVEVKDPGLKNYILLSPQLVPSSHGRFSTKPFQKARMNLLERFANKLCVPGHFGKRHKLSSGRLTGKKEKKFLLLLKALEKIEQRTKKNPLEILVRAVENAALREEIAGYQVGGIIVRRAVVTSPQRRINLALSNLAQAAYRKSFGKKIGIVDALVDELLGAYQNDPSKSAAVKEKERIEKEAEGAR